MNIKKIANNQNMDRINSQKKYDTNNSYRKSFLIKDILDLDKEEYFTEDTHFKKEQLKCEHDQSSLESFSFENCYENVTVIQYENSNGKLKKCSRNTLSSSKLKILEDKFKKRPYIDCHDIASVAEELKLDERKVC